MVGSYIGCGVVCRPSVEEPREDDRGGRAAGGRLCGLRSCPRRAGVCALHIFLDWAPSAAAVSANAYEQTCNAAA